MTPELLKEIFQIVLERNEYQKGICEAISDLYAENIVTDNEMHYLHNQIHIALEGNLWVTLWLERVHTELYYTEIKKYPSRQDFHYAYRKAWIEAIIERGYI